MNKINKIFFILNLVLLVIISFTIFNNYALNKELSSQTLFENANFESEKPVLRVERYINRELNTLAFSEEEQKELIKSLSNTTFVRSDENANIGDFIITLMLNKYFTFSIDSEKNLISINQETYKLKDSNFIELLLNQSK